MVANEYTEYDEAGVQWWVMTCNGDLDGIGGFQDVVHCIKSHFKKYFSEANSVFKMHLYTFIEISTQKALGTQMLPIKFHGKSFRSAQKLFF
jgi:hypothetical protein